MPKTYHKAWIIEDVDIWADKRSLQEALLFCFHFKKTDAEYHRILWRFSENSPMTDWQWWFRRSRQIALGRENKFEKAELEAILYEDSSSTLEKLEVIQNEKYYLLIELKRRDVENRSITCEKLLQPAPKSLFLSS